MNELSFFIKDDLKKKQKKQLTILATFYFAVTRNAYFISLDSLLFIAQNLRFDLKFILTITSLTAAERWAIPSDFQVLMLF